jgi:hypothetical protein
MYYVIKTKTGKVKTITAAYLANRLKKNGTASDPITSVSYSFEGSMPRGENKVLPRVKYWIEVGYIPGECLNLLLSLNKYHGMIKFKFGDRKLKEFEKALFEGDSLKSINNIINIKNI